MSAMRGARTSLRSAAGERHHGVAFEEGFHPRLLVARLSRPAGPGSAIRSGAALWFRWYAWRVGRHECHLVLCEAASFVAAEDLSASKGFRCREPFHDGLSHRKALHSESQGYNRHDGKTLRYGSHSKRHSNRQHLQQGFPLERPNTTDDEDHKERRDCQLLAQLCHSLLKRRFRVLGVLNVVYKLTKPGVAAGCNHEARALSRNHERRH